MISVLSLPLFRLCPTSALFIPSKSPLLPVSPLPPISLYCYSTEKPHRERKGRKGKTKNSFSHFPPPTSPPAPPTLIPAPEGFDPYPDPYHHLHDSSLPKVRKFITAQNRHASRWFEKEKKLVEALVGEISAGQKADNDIAIFTKNGSYWYFFRFDEGDNLPTLYRCSQDAVTSEVVEGSRGFYDELKEVEERWEMVLSVSEEGEEEGFVGVDLMKMSLDGRYLGYLRDLTGGEDYSLLFRDVETGQNFGEEIPSVRGYAWSSPSPSSPFGSNPTVFYAKTDDSGRPYKVFHHTLGDSIENDTEIFVEDDPSRYVSLYTTRDSKYVIITSNSKTSSEVRAFSVEGERDDIVWERREGEFYVEHRSGYFYIVTNLGREGVEGERDGEGGEVNDYCVKRAAVSSPSVWEDVPLPNKEILDPLQDITVFQKCLVLFRRDFSGAKKVEIVHFKEGEEGGNWGHEVEDVVDLDFDPLFEKELLHREYDTNEIDFLLDSGLGEERLHRYFLNEKKSELIHRTKSDFSSKTYETLRTFAPFKNSSFPDDASIAKLGDASVVKSDSGIPITLIRPKGESDKPTPLLLHVYGAYGESLTPRFEEGYSSLLSRGWSLGYAHVRGGGEKGKQWHAEGKGLKKEHSIDDLISCAEFLVSSGYTTPNQMALSAFSAGGLTAAAALNRTGTSLFQVALLGFPFVDPVTTLMDETLPLSVQEYEEWGNPRDTEVYRTLERYDPYRNIGDRDYPAVFVRGSMVDRRVLFWQPLKYATRLQQMREERRRRKKGGEEQGKGKVGEKEGGDVIMLMDEETGHHGDGGRFSSVAQQAFDVAFLLRGVEEGTKK